MGPKKKKLNKRIIDVEELMQVEKIEPVPYDIKAKMWSFSATWAAHNHSVVPTISR